MHGCNYLREAVGFLPKPASWPEQNGLSEDRIFQDQIPDRNPDRNLGNLRAALQTQVTQPSFIPERELGDSTETIEVTKRWDLLNNLRE